MRNALALVVAVTLLRWGLLAFDRTDLFVDEAQYWLWAQSLDFGYYSKPPLIAWVIGAVTSVLGDGAFAIRLPGAALHGVTALLLGAVAAQRLGEGTRLWAVALYLLAPFVAVGSLMISTDTVMLPCLALALYAHGRIGEGSRWAVAAGAALGLAALGKYAALYGLAALLVAGREGWRDKALMALACLAVLSPNLWWNAQHQFATLSHTGDNIGWIKGKETSGGLGETLEFLVTQFAVFGPVSFVALGLGLRRGPRDLVVFAALPLILVAGQAFMAKAYANWAVAAYAPGTILAARVLARAPRGGRIGLSLNAAFALALPLLTLAPEIGIGDRPFLTRYLGRADLSRQILDAGRAEGLPVVTSNRDILADLFYTGRDGTVAIHAFPYLGPPRNFYEQVHALPETVTGDVLYVGELERDCPATWAKPLQGKGVWADTEVRIRRLPAACLRP